jgi:hypothetical protein
MDNCGWLWWVGDCGRWALRDGSSGDGDGNVVVVKVVVAHWRRWLWSLFMSVDVTSR